MSNEFPHPVIDQLQRLCVRDRSPAYVCVGKDGSLLGWGGFCENYGLSGLTKGAPAAHQIDFLEGILPLEGSALHLPFLELTPDVTADLYLFANQEGDWLLLLDSTVEARRLSELQQSGNEAALSRRKGKKLFDELQRSHENLLAILNQLLLITVIIDEDGKVAFLSQAGRGLLAIDDRKAIGRDWGSVLGFPEEHRRKLSQLMRAPPGKRSRLLLETQVAQGDRRWFEVDVRDDPGNRKRRLLYLYDVSDIHNMRKQIRDTAAFHGILGRSAEMKRIFGLVQELAGIDTTVLIEGETGTGKELVARAIHDSSHRADKPFVTVNSAGLSDSLINSQLFGHRKGAFTDAVSDQEGVFEAANGGTIFLDEIGDIPLNTQKRILRVLEQREIVRVGETEARKIQIRILAATHRNLDQEVHLRNFRTDLLYRIRVARVHIPPLRSRREDIPLLVESFLETARASTRKRVAGVNPEAMRMLMEHSWPGNVRELRNAIEFAVISCRGSSIAAADLPPEVTDVRLRSPTRRPYGIDEERERILEALKRTGGKRTEAAKLLGIGRATLYRRMRACMLDPKSIPACHEAE